MNLARIAMNNRGRSLNVLKEANMSSTPSNLFHQLNNNFPYQNRNSELPLEVEEKPNWSLYQSEDKIFLKKRYRFNTPEQMKYFLIECIDASSFLHHFPNFAIKEKIVDIILFTQGVNDVTEQDKKLSKVFDDIFKETKVAFRS